MRGLTLEWTARWWLRKCWCPTTSFFSRIASVFAISILLILVLLDFVSQELLEPVVLGSLVVEVGLVGLVGVERCVEVVDVLVGVGV